MKLIYFSMPLFQFELRVSVVSGCYLLAAHERCNLWFAAKFSHHHPQPTLMAFATFGYESRYNSNIVTTWLNRQNREEEKDSLIPPEVGIHVGRLYSTFHAD